MNYAIHHINVHTSNIERMKSFYEEAFGFTLAWDHYLENYPEFVEKLTGIKNPAARVVTLHAGNLFLELFQWSSPEPNPVGPLKPNDLGYTHIAIAVEDIQATYARVASLGMEFLYPSPLEVEANGEVYGSVYGRDPDGNLIELTQIPAGDQLSLDSLVRHRH